MTYCFRITPAWGHLARTDWGTPLQDWMGYPWPGLDRVPSGQDWMGYLSYQDWMGTPPIRTGWGTPLARTGWGTPHPEQDKPRTGYAVVGIPLVLHTGGLSCF